MKNKYLYVTVGIIVIATMACVAMTDQKSCDAKSCPQQTAEATQEAKSEMEMIKDNLNSGAILIDVRTPEEYAEAHAQGAINLSYDQITSGMYPTEDRGVKLYLYCGSGRRAGIALSALQQAGYADTINLISLDNWRDMGGQVVR
jgi:phage shock protein E